MKKILSMFLALCMVLTMLPTVAMAAADDIFIAPIKIWVDGTQVTSANANDVLGDGKVSYNDSTNTLTLTGADITTAYEFDFNPFSKGMSGIYVKGDLNLVLVDSNSIGGSSFDTTGAVSAGIFVSEGDLNISGTGSLTVTAGKAESSSTGVDIENFDKCLTISGGANVTAIGGTGFNSHGIFINGSLMIDGGSLTAMGDSTGESSQSFGAYGGYINSSFTIKNGGSLTAVGGNAKYNSGGAYFYNTTNNIIIDGGNLIASAGEAANASTGIRSDSISISDGTVTAIGETATASNGINCSTINISGGTVTASAQIKAMRVAPTFDSGYTHKNTAGSNVDSSGATVVSDTTLADGIADYKYIKIEPSTTKTPTTGDLNYVLSAVDYDGNAKPMSVTAASGKTLGAITVKYNGSTTEPINAGTYAIAVDIAGNTEYNAVTGLSLGSYTINKVTYTGTTTVSASVLESGQTGAIVTLPILPTGASYGIPTTGGAITMTSMSIAGTTLTYTAPASNGTPTTGGAITMTIPVTGATNYNNYSIVVTVTYTAKTPQAISYAASTVAKTYGDAKFVNPLTQTTGNGTITYASDDASVATVNTTTGEVTIVAVGDGSVIITATAAETGTHAQATAIYTVTVARKALTLKADDKSMTKGAGLPTLTYTVTGLVNSDTVTTAPTMAATTDGTAAGTFDITISGGVVANAASYDITYTKGALTVTERLFAATVTNGTGSGNYAEGATVTITANDRSGYTFTGWSGTDVTFANAAAKTTTFIMPAKAVNVTANYRQNSSGGDDSGNTSSPTPTPDSGKTDKSGGQVEKEQQQNDGAPAVSVNNSGDELKSRVLTLAEQEMVANGENVKVILKVTDISTSVSDEEKKLIHKKLASENGAADISILYVDLSLYKQVGSKEQAKVTETKGKISISLEVPEGFWNTDITKSRAFYVIRIHDGAVTKIEGSYDPATHLFTFETDRFSTYALTYQDTSRIQTYHDFHHLQLKAKADKTSQTLSYKRIANADGYLIYGGKCGEEMTELAKLPAKITSYTVKSLKQGTNYKYQVKAYRMIDGEQVIIMTSKVIHSITKSKKYGNPTKVTTDSASVALTEGKTKTVTGQVVLPKGKKQKEHTAVIRYESSDKVIATVNSKGKITAKRKGSCYVYAYAQNGVYKKIKVTVE